MPAARLLHAECHIAPPVPARVVDLRRSDGTQAALAAAKTVRIHEADGNELGKRFLGLRSQ